tara:strand:+ start:714 stop:1979 length:1266 start_codon:yes stop_codon:yes gene_type:complete
MEYKAKAIKIDDTGERAILIVDGLGLPVDMPSRYLLRLRDPRATKTVLNLAKNICQLYRWADELGADIEERIKLGHIFGITEIDSLVRYLSLNRRQVLKQETNNQENIVQFAGYVSGAMLKQKIDAVKNYFTWLGQLAVENRLITDPYYAAIRPAIKDLNEQLDARKTSSKSKPRVGLTEIEQQHLLDVTHPDNLKNPFELRTRARNHLILKLLLMCGVRLGELLALKVENCHLIGDSPYLYFGHNITKEKDPRPIPPDVKTLPRRIYITPSLADEVDSYIMNERKSRGREARKAASYVFLNTYIIPTPMSEGAIYHITNLLRDKFPDHLANLHPHRLRHTFNDNLVLTFADSMKEEEFLNLQRWLNGWCDTSSEGRTYTHRSQEIRVQRCLTTLQNNIIEGNWKKEDITAAVPYDEDVLF